MLDRLTTMVHRFAGRRALLIGDLILDQYIYGDAERISPEAPVPVLRIRERDEKVGGSANVAACLRALKLEVTCCGVIGRDRSGDRLVGLLGELGVSDEGLVRSETRPTTVKTRMVGLAQHRHRQQLMRLDEEETGALAAVEESRLIEAGLASLQSADVVCIEDYEKGVVSRRLVEAITAEARKMGKLVLVDPGRTPRYDKYAGAHVFTPNRAELAIAVGEKHSIEEMAAAADALRGHLRADAFVVTLDRDGALLVRDGRPFEHISTRPRSVYDNTGAGDAVLAMLAASVAAGADLSDAVRLANIAGGLEVEKFGCVPIEADEILAELRLEGNRRNGKLRTVDELVAELTLRRDRGETVVFTNGCFDILHAGHVDYLSRCRDEGSILVVGLNSDGSVRAQNKGDGRPFNSAEDRAKVLGGLGVVDYVVLFDEPTPELLIRRVRPDVLVKGEDWADKGVVGRDSVEASGGRVVLVPLLAGRSTTTLVERIRQSERDR